MSKSFVAVAKASSIVAGTPFPVTSGETTLLLCRDGDEIFAVEDRCSHMEVKLRTGKLEGRIITCRAHGAQFDITTGAAKCMPAVRAIKTFPVRLSGDDVEVEIPDDDE